MVRKVTACIVSLVLIVAVVGSTAQAYDIYEGNISTTYIQYFKDILSGSKWDTDYVAFRSGQNEYILLAGELEKEGSIISVNGTAKEYKYYTVSGTGMNNQQRYNVTEVNSGSVNVGNYIIYSNLGDYPELIERGDKYEALTLFVIVVLCISVVINRIFFKR